MSKLSPKHNQQSALEQAGKAADQVAARHVFDDYRTRRPDSTLRTQDQHLSRFAQFLASINAAPASALNTDPAAWHGVTWGLIEAYKRWLLTEGYAIATINLALSTVKVYAKLASQAGILDKITYLQIKDVAGYPYSDADNIDQHRTKQGMQTRRPTYDEDGNKRTIKKASPVRLSDSDVYALKHHQPDDAQGRRDALLMCILLDLGLRCGEVARLRVEDVDLVVDEITFYRPKVKKTQTHQFPSDLRHAMHTYFAAGDALDGGPLLRGSRRGYERKDGTVIPPRLLKTGMSERAITARVKLLGAELGINRLSAHDCRHYWATRAARNGTDAFALQEAGGWSSLAMPRRYVEAARIANEGVKFDDE